MIGTDGERERESQGNACQQLDLMMMIMMIYSNEILIRVYTVYKDQRKIKL